MKHRTALPALIIIVSLNWLVVVAPASSAQTLSHVAEPLHPLDSAANSDAQNRADAELATPTSDGVRLHCMFQKLEGEVTREGLWLSSTAGQQTGEKFRVVARAWGREDAMTALPTQGAVAVTDKAIRYARPGLIEEYSASVNGVRQDFVVTGQPAGNGPLRIELDVTGAKAEALANGARLVPTGCGREIVYTRLHVVDANDETLTAWLEVTSDTMLTILVQDARATYPVRIDPTFRDADWLSVGDMVFFPEGSGAVFTTVVDAFGNLYVGGGFTRAGGISATNVAKWNGNTWSALGIGLNGTVRALAISGDEVYVGGEFTTAGGISANHVAKWNGSTWSPLGTGLNATVRALAVSGDRIYAGGDFDMAGGTSAISVAEWNGSTWLPLGSGAAGRVNALTVSGSDLYVGGEFIIAGDSNANRVAKWNGSAWSPLGLGLNDGVLALTISGSDLFVGGRFTTAEGISASRVAKWNGTVWSALGSGVGSPRTLVATMAVSGSNLYVGGNFFTAGGSNANYVAQWNEGVWSRLGSGLNQTSGGFPYVFALAVSGTDLYAGGIFNMAGGKPANNLARAIGPPIFNSMLPEPSPNQMLLTFTSAPGASLHVLSSTDLATWQTNATVTATNVTNSVSIEMAQPQEFFQLQRLP